MLIKMLETHRGSEDGFEVKRYYAGREYEMGDSLARSFIRNKWAERIVPLTEGQVKCFWAYTMKKCWIFHKWTEWKTVWHHGFCKFQQKRECARCGDSDWRVVDC